MSLLDTILQREEFALAPPVLLDLGASAGLPAKWKALTPYSICIAFDADKRAGDVAEGGSADYRKLLVLDDVVTSTHESEVDFYLTRFPFCSSTLPPDMAELEHWAFRPLFEVQEKVRVKALRLEQALVDAGLDRIDWIKIDTQGTDLRLFRSLPARIRNRVLAAEFEPGIVGVYENDDKLWEVMRFFSGTDFYMSGLEIRGTQRFSPEAVSGLSRFHREASKRCLAIAPGWGEATYLNTLSSRNERDLRAHLLAFVFAWIERQYGFALEIAERGRSRFGDPVFDELGRRALAAVKAGNLKLPLVLLHKKLNQAAQRLLR